MRRFRVPENIAEHDKTTEELFNKIGAIRQRILNLGKASPEATVIIPAYNEERNILRTLSSLSKSTTVKSIRFLVVNNNSSDATPSLATAAGASCIDEPEQGITAARNRGLKHAKGHFILNADADTIYPPEWIDLMLQPLSDEKVALVYGDHYFLPGMGNSRAAYFLYEHLADIKKMINRNLREEAVNVYGFNSAFRRSEGIDVDGFNHPSGTNEDGWLAVKLRDRFQKKLFHQSHPAAMVWTSNRRLEADGGVIKAAGKRVLLR
ncbi:MAG: glycosyltransferase family 2 protein [Chitinophagaceae bacterium]